jgi:hypothetical protein
MPGKDRQLLIEYQLTEKVEDRVVKTLRLYGGILVAGLTIFGVFGLTSGVGAIGRRVANAVKKSVEADIASLRTSAQTDMTALHATVQTAMVDLNVAVREARALSDRSQKQLDELASRSGQLEDLSSRYEALRREIVAVDERARQAIQETAEAVADTKNLRAAVVGSLAGRPSILSVSYGMVGGRGEIKGANFGTAKGTLRLTLQAHTMPLTRMQPQRNYRGREIEVEEQRIHVWTDNEIVFDPPDDLPAAADEFSRAARARAEAENPTAGVFHVSVMYGVEIRRSDGVTIQEPAYLFRLTPMT